MTYFSDLIFAFKNQGLELIKKEDAYQIKNSSALPKRIAENIIVSANHCPILSQNRINGEIEFIVVPYKKPARFDKAEVKKMVLTKVELWSSIESTLGLAEEGKPICVNGQQFFESLAEAKEEMALACNKISSLMVEFLDKTVSPGAALDLGCGSGANSIPLLEKGWQVTAIDNCPPVVDLYRRIILKKNKEYLENGQLILIEQDITNYSFPQNKFDLIVCVDVLPYIAPKKLHLLMDKIHEALVLNGQLLGTLFFSAPNNSKECEELLGKMGAHFYQGEFIVPALLEHTGFDIEECTLRFDSGVRSMCAQFIARKRIG